jgi:hypothetical protein
MNRTLASITTHTSLLVPQFRRLREQNMIPTFIMEKLDLIPHLEGNNDGDPRQGYSQWQRWARKSSHRSRQRRHVDPHSIKSSDLLSEYVDPQSEHHMIFPEQGSFVPTKRKSTPVQSTTKAIPVNSNLYPNPDSIHDCDDEVDVVSLFSSHGPYSPSASMSLATTILTEEGEEKSQEPFEMDASFNSLQYSKCSSLGDHDACQDHKISPVPRKTTGSGSGLGQDLRMTIHDSSLNTTILRAKSSIIRQQEAIMRDIEERQAAELHQQRERQQQQQEQRREKQEREALSSTATAKSAIAVDAGFLIQKPESTSTGPVQDPLTILNKQASAVATTKTNTDSINVTSRQVAASSGGNWLEILRGRRVRILDDTPGLVQQQHDDASICTETAVAKKTWS